MKGQAASGDLVEVEVAADPAGGSARTVKLELHPGRGSRITVPAFTDPGKQGQSLLWPIGLGVLALLGFVLKAILADAFEAIGVAIARSLGADRVGKRIEQRFARGRTVATHDGKPTTSEPGDSTAQDS